MVLNSGSPLLNLDTQSVHQIDTNNTVNLHALWSVCSRCARTETLPNAQRLENLTWRLYSQQTLSHSPERRSKLPNSYPISRYHFSSDSVPGLSQSPESPISSDDEMGTPPCEDVNTTIHHMGSMEMSKSISPGKFETLVKSVTENNELEPLSLPPTICLPQARQPATLEPPTHAPLYQEPEAPQNDPAHHSLPCNRDVESSTSTVATTAVNSEIFENGHLQSVDSASTEVSSMSIVRGFSKENISQVRRSRTQLAPPPSAPPQPILKQPSPSNLPRYNPLARPKGSKKAKFMLGASSEGDDSSYESPEKGSLVAGLHALSISHENSESAIEDEDEEASEWVDEDDEPQPETSFQRVESTANLRSRPSLLTNMLHETDRAKALQNAASRSTPAIRRSRTSSHNGPLGSSPQCEQPQLSRARPISSSHRATEAMPIALSPRTNRRNMLATELTGSLRKNLLWERQQRNPASKALKNRQFRSEIRLTDAVNQPHLETNHNLRRNDTTNFYDNGLQEYFEKGW